MRDPKLGDKENFVPESWAGTKDPRYLRSLTGVVVNVNQDHRHYTLAAECNGCIIRENFKF